MGKLHKPHKELRPLDDKHLALSTAIISIFKSNCYGVEKAIKNNVLISILANRFSIATTGREIRHVLGYIRANDLLNPAFIVSDVNEGYWLTNDVSELNDFLEKQLNRMSSQFQNIKLLHQRIRYAKKNTPELQPILF
jgi:hypothetical protein